jgi:hypothetical protein
MILIKDAEPFCRHNFAILRQNFSAAAGFPWHTGPPQWGDRTMTENTHHDARRNSLREAALEEMLKFERRETEFRRKDREERAADLRLPLHAIKVH